MPIYHTGRYPEKKQSRGDIKFMPDEIHKLFGCRCLLEYSDIAKAPKNITIGGSPTPTLGSFSTISKSPKGKSITCPTKFLQHVHMDTRYGDHVTLGSHRYVLNLVDRST